MAYCSKAVIDSVSHKYITLMSKTQRNIKQKEDLNLKNKETNNLMKMKEDLNTKNKETTNLMKMKEDLNVKNKETKNLTPSEKPPYILRNNRVVPKSPVIMNTPFRKSTPRKKNTKKKKKLAKEYKLKAQLKSNIKNIGRTILNSRISEKQSPTKPYSNNSPHNPAIYQDIIPNALLNASLGLRLDATSKLNIIELYRQLKSMRRTSELTGISEGCIRYWKKNEESLKKKVQSEEYITNTLIQLDSHLLPGKLKTPSPKKVVGPPLDFSCSLATVNDIDTDNNSSTLSAGHSGGSPLKVVNLGDKVSPSKMLKQNSPTKVSPKKPIIIGKTRSSAKDRLVDMKTTITKQITVAPDFHSIAAIVEEINKLSSIYNSSENLEFLNNHFKTQRYGYGLEKSHDKTSLLAKTKVQEENMKHIISDFFHGEYRLLLEIDHQFQQLMDKKKSKTQKEKLDELRKYFHGSIQRLHVLKQQLA